MKRASLLRIFGGLVATIALSGIPTSAQSDVTNPAYHPLDQSTPPGVAGSWMAIAGRPFPYGPMEFQPVRVELPGDGVVEIFQGTDNRPMRIDTQVSVRLAIGHIYRLKVSNVAEFPGIEVYPSVEMLNKLHPPLGQENQFPVPLWITSDDIEQALDGRLVTKVIYLEDPRLARPPWREGELSETTLPHQQNILKEADRLGRPMAIVRIGGRMPDPESDNSTFFGSGAPIAIQPEQKSAE